MTRARDLASNASGAAPTIVDAKGDLLVGTAADTAARLAVGSNDTVLTADSSTATGLKWGTVSAGSNWTLLNTGGTSLSGSATVTVSGISGKDKILVCIYDASSASAYGYFGVRFNTDSSAIYNNFGFYLDAQNSGTLINGLSVVGDTKFNFGRAAGDGSSIGGYLLATGCNSSGSKAVQFAGGGNNDGGIYNNRAYSGGGTYDGSSTISSVSVIVTGGGNFDTGTVYVYTSA